jgi:anti-anti-sigma factor
LGDHALVVSALAARGGAVIVSLRGDLDISTVPQALDALCELADGRARRVVADLSSLEFMATAGARALLDTQTLLIRNGGSMALASPRPVVARLLQLTGIDQRIPVYGSVAGAVRGRVPMPSRAP